MAFDRRKLLMLAGQIGLAATVPAARLAATPRGDYPFRLGVASGDPWPDGFVIWTRLAPRPLDEHGGMPQTAFVVCWEVAHDEGFKAIARKGVTLARPEFGHSVHVEVEGLQPFRHYWYRFTLTGGEASPVGRARTAPAAGSEVDRLRLAVAGCQHWEAGFFDAWGHLAAEPDLDLVFHYGDYIYEGASRPLGKNIVRQHVGAEATCLDDYRRRHAQYKTDPHLQAAHASCAFVTSFDDHEVDNNWAGDHDQDGTAPERFAVRRRAALQAWYENMPLRRAQRPGANGPKSFRRLNFGRLLRMHVLDTRSYRSDQPCNDGKIEPCPISAHDSPTVLGAPQESWLRDSLRGGSRWDLLAQQVLVMPYTRFKKGESESFTSFDTWDGYRPARERLIGTIREAKPTNLIIASGDFHRNIVGTLPARDEAPDGNQVAVEFLASSISSRGTQPYAAREKPANPHLSLVETVRGYHVHEITAQRWRTEVRAMDTVERPGGACSTLAKFEVQTGRAEVHPI